LDRRHIRLCLSRLLHCRELLRYGGRKSRIAVIQEFRRLRNGEVGAKEAGKMRLEGKEYIVRDGDVMTFRFNA